MSKRGTNPPRSGPESPKSWADEPSWQRPKQRKGPPTLPQQGDELFGFRLGGELGQGSFARVFLAEQAHLAGRPVVLKVSDTSGDEPQILAQVQHTHIVPIYSLHEDRSAGLRAVCMPYFGGASLADVLAALREHEHKPTRGEQLRQALARVAGPTARPDHIEHLADISWGRWSYPRAVVWIVSCLADALAHAHQRGVLHRDVKPSNVLLAADGQPMLLDFNVSLQVADQTGETRRALGGTVAYMSPEHLRALTTHDPVLAQSVDHRSDVYSLGMVFYEMLTGSRPFEVEGSYSPLRPMVEAMAMERRRLTPSARKLRPDLPWGLESIVRTCLAPDPARRYQRAQDLAEDCRCFLDDHPLRHAPELSVAERLGKWGRRHPRLTSSVSVAVVAVALLAAVGAGVVYLRHHLADTRERLADTQSRERLRSFQAGADRALCLINTVSELHDHLREGARLCADTLALYSILDRDDWQQAPDWQRLSTAEQQAAAEDARELLLLLAWARHQMTTQKEEACRQALALLARAEAVEKLSPSRALWEDKARYLEQLGNQGEAQAARAQAARLQPVSARDHYLLALVSARAGQYEQAVTHLDRAIDLNPKNYWSIVQRGICYQELGHHALATADFGVAIGLWPEFAWGYFNRGYALEKSGNKAEAIRDYSSAIDRDPTFVLAVVNRGLAYLEVKQHARALRDFDRAAELGRDDAFLHLGRGVALEGLRRSQEADAEFARAFGRASEVSPSARTQMRWVYAFAISARLPSQARDVFEEILRSQPDHPQALYGRAMLLVEDRRENEAVATFDRLLAVSPHFAEARRFRAILLARAGSFAAASQDINWCLEKEPRSGAVLYAAACVAALAAERTPDPAVAKQALTLLRQAFERGYGRDKADRDPDLKGIRNHPEFPRLEKDRPDKAVASS